MSNPQMDYVPKFVEDGKETNSTPNSLFTYCNNFENYHYIGIGTKTILKLQFQLLLHYVGIQSI